MALPRPKTKRHGQLKAGELLCRLSLPEFRAAMQLTPDQVAVLDKIANGKPVRNAMAIIKAIALKADYAYEKPKQSVEHGVSASLAELVNASLSGDK